MKYIPRRDRFSTTGIADVFDDEGECWGVYGHNALLVKEGMPPEGINRQGWGFIAKNKNFFCTKDTQSDLKDLLEDVEDLRKTEDIDYISAIVTQFRRRATV